MCLPIVSWSGGEALDFVGRITVQSPINAIGMGLESLSVKIDPRTRLVSPINKIQVVKKKYHVFTYNFFHSLIHDKYNTP